VRPFDRSGTDTILARFVAEEPPDGVPLGHPATHQNLNRCKAMTIRLNHTIVAARDKAAGALFLTEILGLAAPTLLGPFAVVQVGDDTSLDFLETDEPIVSQHYAFLVSETEFDEIFARIRQRSLPYWADPGRQQRDQINSWDDGRGVYFDDPNGHLLEIITRPYGSGGTTAAHPHPLIAPTLTEKDGG
jgi:catechol 2,3-dioxygenase-like lactoylglutathione lyase family enzyme